MKTESTIPSGECCMVSDPSEAYASSLCPMLYREMGGSGSVGCEGVILCPMRVYRCKRYPAYELAVRRGNQKVEVLKCPECRFDEEMNRIGGELEDDPA